jgi:hypothetical protein
MPNCMGLPGAINAEQFGSYAPRPMALDLVPSLTAKSHVWRTEPLSWTCKATRLAHDMRALHGKKI